MSIAPLVDHGQTMPDPQGHSIGFFDTKAECDDFIKELNAAGFPDTSITILSGVGGIELLNRMMAGSLWGESDEDVLKQGTIELSNGHFVLTIESRDRDQALLIAKVSEKHGGHSFYYFGILTDERLTR
jgi:hypothetical protein